MQRAIIYITLLMTTIACQNQSEDRVSLATIEKSDSLTQELN